MYSREYNKTKDTIWIISPSAGVYPFFPHRFENAVKNLESMWFKVKFAKNSKNMLDISQTVLKIELLIYMKCF